MSHSDKLAKIEELIRQASSEGERQTAQFAKDRLVTRIFTEEQDKPIEYKISLESPWETRLFLAVCGKHKFKTYRYPRQKYTTTCLKISKAAMDDILWPDFLQHAHILRELIEDITKEVIYSIYPAFDHESMVTNEINASRWRLR